MVIDAQLLNKLICINCNNSALQQREDELICSACGKSIALNHGIPDFLSAVGNSDPTWDKNDLDHAIGYEHFISEAIPPYRLNRIDKPILQFVKGDVLEVGCGTCRLAEEVRKRGARYFGLDPMNSYLRYAYNVRGLRGLVRGQGERLPFHNNSFDYIISGYYAYRNVNPDLGLLEARRVLKPGGKFVFDLLNHWLVKFMELKNLIRSGKLNRLRYFCIPPISGVFEFINVSQLKHKAAEFGFLVEDLISTPIIPIAIFSFIDLNKYLSNVYFRGKKTIYLGYDVIITLKAI